MARILGEHVDVKPPTGVEKQFPMFVTSFSKLLQKDCFELHELLMERGELTEWNPGLGPVAFLSQTWFSCNHPDPKGTKHSLVKRVAKRILADDFHIDTHWFTEMLFGAQSMSMSELKDLILNGYYWIDIEGVPQTNPTTKAMACNSIPWYVQESSFFWVLVPPEMHKERASMVDFSVWAKRGWCRAERSMNYLSRNPMPSLIIESSVPFIALDTDWLFSTPCVADFTVDSDKEVVGPILEAALNDRISLAKDAGNLIEHRFLKSILPYQLKGWGGREKSPAETLDYDNWMIEFGFIGPKDGQESGWTPLRFAMYLKRFDIAEQLLQRGADIEAPLVDTYNQYGQHVPGATIFYAVAFMDDHPESLKFLLEKKANPDPETYFPGTSALHVAMDRGRVENSRFLLEQFPSFWVQPNNFGVCPGHIGVLWGCMLPEHRQHLLESKDTSCLGPSVSAWCGLNFVGIAVFEAAEPDILDAILATDADINHKSSPQDMSMLTWALFKSCQVAVMISRRPAMVSELFANLDGGTPLMFASFLGKYRCVDALLKAKALVDETNSYNRTALSIAAGRGHAQIVLLLLNAKANCTTRDTSGLLAIDVANARGHTDIVNMICTHTGQQPPPGIRSLFRCCAEVNADEIIVNPSLQIQSVSVLP